MGFGEKITVFLKGDHYDQSEGGLFGDLTIMTYALLASCQITLKVITTENNNVCACKRISTQVRAATHIPSSPYHMPSILLLLQQNKHQ